MTQPQQMLACRACGSIRANGPWCYHGTPKLALVSIQADQLLPCPVCVLIAAMQEMREHVQAIEAEMAPVVEEAVG